MAQNCPVGRGPALGRGDGFGRALHAAFQIRKGGISLGPAQRGQNHIGPFGRLGQIEFLDDEQVQRIQLLRPIRAFTGRVRAHHIERFDAAVQHLLVALAHRCGQLALPQIFQTLDRIRTVQSGVAGQPVGQDAHIPCALAVGIQPHKGQPVGMASEEGQIRQPVADGRAVAAPDRLGSVDDQRLLALGQHRRSRFDSRRVCAAKVCQRPVVGLGGPLFYIGQMARCGRVQPLFLSSRGPQQTVEERRFGPRLVGQIRAVVAGQFNFARVGNNQLCAALFHGPFQVQVQNRQFLAGVDAKEENRVHLGVRPVLGLHHRRQRGQTGRERGHICAVPVVDIIRADNTAKEPLQGVVAFVADFGAANRTDGRRAVLLLHRLQFPGDKVQGFAPLHGNQFPILAQEGRLQPVLAVDPGVGKAAFVADPLVVDLHVFPANDAADGMGAGVHPDVAAHRAVVTDAGRAFDLPRAVGEAGNLVGQRTHRADVDDIAAGLGVHRLAVLDVDDRPVAPVVQAELGFVLPLFQITDAAPAEYTALLIQDNHIGDVVIFLCKLLGFHQLADPRPKTHCLVLQRTFAGFVADGAVERVVEQNKAEIGLLHLAHLLGSGMDDHSLGHRGGTGRRQARTPGAFDLHHTHPAAAHRVQLRVGAEDRDFDIGRLRRVHQ